MAKKRKTTGKKSGGGGKRFPLFPASGNANAPTVAPVNPLRRDETETIMPEHRRPHEERAAEIAKDAGIGSSDDD